MTKGQNVRTIPTTSANYRPGRPLLEIYGRFPIVPQNAGLFISRGVGMHPARIIDSHELIFVRKGHLGMFEEQRKFNLGPGQALLLWPGRKHGGTMPYPPDLSFYWIHFKISPVKTKNRTNVLLSAPQMATARRPERLTELFRRFLDDQESGILTPVSGACLVMQMLNELGQARRRRNLSCSLLAARAGEYIKTNFARPVSTRDIAGAMHVNPDYLERVFRQTFGFSLTHGLHQRRIQHARTLLMDSMFTVKEITQACGFNDPVYFRRVFERHSNMTPLAFRRLYSRVHINTV